MKGSESVGTGHAKPGLVQLSVTVGLKDLFDFTIDSATYIDAAFLYKVVEGLAHCTTDYELNPKFFHFGSPLINGQTFHWNCSINNLLFAARFRQQEHVARVQNRRDPAHEDRQSDAPGS